MSLGEVFMPKGMPIVLSSFAIDRSMWLWGTDAEEPGPELWASGEDGAAAVESNCGFLTSPAGPRVCIGNVFAKMELKGLFAAVIYRFQLERDWRREVT